MAVADDGWWDGTDYGYWSVAGNWVDSIIADGADNTAYFTMNISGNMHVDLDGHRTIGHLEFSDGGGSGSYWFLSDYTGVKTLTLAAPGGTPTCQDRNSAKRLLFRCPQTRPTNQVRRSARTASCRQRRRAAFTKQGSPTKT